MSNHPVALDYSSNTVIKLLSVTNHYALEAPVCDVYVLKSYQFGLFFPNVDMKYFVHFYVLSSSDVENDDNYSNNTDTVCGRLTCYGTKLALMMFWFYYNSNVERGRQD